MYHTYLLSFQSIKLQQVDLSLISITKAATRNTISGLEVSGISDGPKRKLLISYLTVAN